MKRMVLFVFALWLSLVATDAFAVDGDLYVNGNVGIGTTSPGTQLDVNGGIRAGVVTTSCSPSLAGVMRVNNGNYEVCNGSVWEGSDYLVGEIKAYAGPTAPSGYLLCDGSAVSRTTYSVLFAVIGTTYGSGDGSSTFNLPDMRGRTGIGAGAGQGLTNRLLGQTMGEESHVLSIVEMPSHNHGVNDPGHSHMTATGNNIVEQVGYNSGWGFENSGDFHVLASYQGTSNWVRTSYTGISIQNTGGGSAHNVMQPSTVVNYIIKF